MGTYSSYKVSVTEEGYAISYKANDPKSMFITKDIKDKAGFLGLGNNTTKITEEYVMDGQTNQGGAVSNPRSWMDQPPGLTQQQAKEISAARKSESLCQSNRICGRYRQNCRDKCWCCCCSYFSSIPFVGWVAAGWVAMFSGNQGANIGGGMAENLNQNC